MGFRTIRAVVEVQVAGAYTEEALRMEVARLVYHQLEAPAGAKMKGRPSIKSYAKLAAAERRHSVPHENLLKLREIMTDIDNRVDRLEQSLNIQANAA